MISFDKPILKLFEIFKILDINIGEKHIDIEDLGCPHETTTLPKGKMAVYAFFYGNKCLKIGKVGSKSNARYNSHIII